MICKAFASQLEAHVGYSPERGGKAIKTDRQKANNLNQLLSRVKSIFGRKAMPSTTVTPNAEPPTDLSVVSDPRLSAAFADIEKYLAETTILRQQNSAIRITPTAQVSSRKMRYSHHRSSSSRIPTVSTTCLTTC